MEYYTRSVRAYRPIISLIGLDNEDEDDAQSSEAPMLPLPALFAGLCNFSGLRIKNTQSSDLSESTAMKLHTVAAAQPPVAFVIEPRVHDTYNASN
jgi:hypothetical protein